MSLPVLLRADSAAALLHLVTVCNILGDVDTAALVCGSTQLQLKATFLSSQRSTDESCWYKYKLNVGSGWRKYVYIYHGPIQSNYMCSLTQ